MTRKKVGYFDIIIFLEFLKGEIKERVNEEERHSLLLEAGPCMNKEMIRECQ